VGIGTTFFGSATRLGLMAATGVSQTSKPLTDPSLTPLDTYQGPTEAASLEPISRQSLPTGLTPLELLQAGAVTFLTPELAQAATDSSTIDWGVTLAISAGLFYGVPPTRALFRALGLTAKQGIFDWVNRATGWWDKKIALVRDIVTPYAGPTALLGIALFSGSGSVRDYLPHLLLIGGALLSTRFSKHDRTKRIEPQQQEIPRTHLLTAQAWKQHESRAYGIFGDDFPQSFDPSELFKPGLNPRFTGPAKKSWWRNAACVVDVVGIANLFKRYIAETEGPAFEKQRQAFVRDGTFIPADPRHVEIGNGLFRQAAVLGTARLRLNVDVTDERGLLARIPAGEPTVMVAANHDGGWSNYLSPFLIRCDNRWLPIRPVADKQNFFSDPKLRKPIINGFPVAVAKGGLFFAPRDEPSFDWASDMEDKMAMGYIPFVWPQKGRTPRHTDEKGNLMEPGLYSNVISVKHPDLYLARGVTDFIPTFAQEKKKTVYVVIAHMVGGYRSDPKEIKPMPFLAEWKEEKTYRQGDTTHTIKTRRQIGEITTNQTLRIQMTELIRVEPDSDKMELPQMKDDFLRKITAALKRATNTNSRLEAAVATWLPPDLVSTFKQRAAEDEKYYVLANRIFCIPKGHQEEIAGRKRGVRSYFQEEFADLLKASHHNANFTSLLTQIAKKVKEVEYS